MRQIVIGLGIVTLCGCVCLSAAAEQATNPAGAPTNGVAATALPRDYVVGPEDVLSIVFWRDKDMSADVVVRPDGMISLPLLNDVQAAGYTPEQLSQSLEKAGAKFLAEPNVTVIVKEIHSRKVFIVGQVAKPGAFPLTGEMNVLQLIALAGGVLEYANAKNIAVVRKDDGHERRIRVNYQDVLKGKNIDQNILLKPGDTVIVP